MYIKNAQSHAFGKQIYFQIYIYIYIVNTDSKTNIFFYKYISLLLISNNILLSINVNTVLYTYIHSPATLCTHVQLIGNTYC